MQLGPAVKQHCILLLLEQMSEMIAVCSELIVLMLIKHVCNKTFE